MLKRAPEGLFGLQRKNLKMNLSLENKTRAKSPKHLTAEQAG